MDGKIPFAQSTCLRRTSAIVVFPKGDREFVDILLAVQQHGMDIVEQACAKVLSEGTV